MRKNAVFDTLRDGGASRDRTYDQPVMLTTSTFDASFEFVVWTVPSPVRLRRIRVLVCQSLHPDMYRGSGLPWCKYAR